MLEIAISSATPHFSQEHHIFGHNYILEFNWIEREAYWAMHIYDATENPIALGLRLVSGWPLYVDRIKNIAFFLIPKIANAQLTLTRLQSDFMLVVDNESL
jgi:hypothetical protein